ncbi:unnamed protein product [Plutella xylostella]|uniref:(diamondback moth) hypothetical protein n=1 Tax=Plutella xylostella TaxID=51655 RepID=A0A8S4FM78_PLUXY|nr:unnamed protein product [Plutella xylostella]
MMMVREMVKGQKPWAKLLQKVERARQDYHMACKQERTACNQERNAGGDSSLSPDQSCVNSAMMLKELVEGQKPWAKLLQKVERARQDYHMACKQERTACNQERNAGGDSSLSPDQVSWLLM